MEVPVSERIRQSAETALAQASAEEAAWNDDYLLEIEGGDALMVRVRNGTINISAATAGAPTAAECVIRGDEDELVRVLSGESNPQTAWMRGDIEIEGSFGAAYRLYSYIQSKRNTHGATA